VEQAAVMMGVSTRTIARRISTGSLESRVDDNGRRLVLIQSIDSAMPTDSNDTRQTIDGSDDTDVDQGFNVFPALSHEASATTHLATQSGSVAMLAVLQSTIDAARTDARRARSGAQWAWAGVGVLGVVLALGGMWLTRQTTEAATKAYMLEQQVTDVKAELGKTQNELIIVHSAKSLAEARAERVTQERSEAVAALEQERVRNVSVVNRSPSTQPSDMIKSWVTIFGE